MKAYTDEHARLLRAVATAKSDPDKPVADARKDLSDYMAWLLRGGQAELFEDAA